MLLKAGSMDIEIYTADVTALEDTELYTALYRSVSKQRQEKTDSYRFRKDKCLSLGAGVLLERALYKAGVRDFTMTTEKNQKPRLACREDIHFNLSHSGTKVMCVLSDCDVGCDVEQVRDIDIAVARRFFYHEEYDALLAAPESRRRELFFRYWTLKESFMKATGLGFMLPLSSFCILLGEKGISVRQQADGREYHFRELALDDGYKYAVCSAGKEIVSARTEAVRFV